MTQDVQSSFSQTKVIYTVFPNQKAKRILTSNSNPSLPETDTADHDKIAATFTVIYILLITTVVFVRAGEAINSLE